MWIFKKKNHFDFNDLDEVLVEKRVEIFQKVVSPFAKDLGLSNWNGKYLWFNDFNEEGIKHVLEYTVLKGYKGSFSYGVCFNFIPTVSNHKTLVNHKTDKSTSIQMFERLDGWKNSFEKNIRTKEDYVSHFNLKSFEITLDKIIKKYPQVISKWFENNQTLNQCINTLIDQLSRTRLNQNPIPNQNYYLSFLFAKKGDGTKALEYLNYHYERLIDINEVYIDELELVKNRVIKILNDANKV
ncbi:hypothetical protein [Parvicella tangerina]|uniref:DUF4304 domain-containing protein n=1 Tax=Parvicella tangerina TaxID=2829795 RepID=A0A916JLW6_9FLAO|nr:hypothetical protein [Parvicella tangerina]CAG5080954.1 hypothetical protein CRYO30217_01494 [Parvicella tangerina]